MNYTTIIIPETYRANRILFLVENNNWNSHQYLPKMNDFVDGDLVVFVFLLLPRMASSPSTDSLAHPTKSMCCPVYLVSELLISAVHGPLAE